MDPTQDLRMEQQILPVRITLNFKIVEKRKRPPASVLVVKNNHSQL